MTEDAPPSVSEPQEGAASARASVLSRVSLLVPLAALAALLTVLISFVKLPSAEFGLQGTAQALTLILGEPATSDAIVTSQSAVTAGAARLDGRTLEVDPNAVITIMTPPGSPATATFSVPAGWRLRVLAPEHDALSVTALRARADVQQTPSVRYSLPPGARVRYSRDDAQITNVLPAGGELAVDTSNLDLHLTPTAPTTNLFDRLIPTDLYFEQTEETVDPGTGQRGISTFGTIKDGTLWIGRAGQVADLTLVDSLAIEAIAHGRVRPLTVNGRDLSFSARGEARRLTNRPGADPIDLRPSWLDLMVDNGMLKVIAAVVSFIISLELTRLVRKP